MKNYIGINILLIATLIVFSLSSCEDDENGGNGVNPDLPTISIESPTIPEAGYNTETGATVPFTLKLKATQGLSTLKVGTETIVTYTGTETEADAEYYYAPLTVGTETLTFTVEDANGETSSVDAVLIVALGEDLGYLILDFAGNTTYNEEKTVVDWDIRTKYKFDVKGSHGTEATVEVVNKQGQVSFAQANPDASKYARVMKFENYVLDTSVTDDWGGWSHIIFGLGTPLPTEQTNALPKWDPTGSTTIAGTKVIKMDAYYDATVDPDYTWDSVISRTGVWGSDPSQGYSIHLSLNKYDPFATAESAYDGAFNVGYFTYIPEPNKWVTLTFSAVDANRTHLMVDAKGDDAPGLDEIDCIRILPAGGYSGLGGDKNPLYFKNLRIVDAE